MKKVLILGGEGFIGKNISDVVSNRYDCYSCGIEKSLFPNNRAKYLDLNPYQKPLNGSYEVVINLIDNQVPFEEIEVDEGRMLSNLLHVRPKQIILFSSAVTYADPNSDYGKRKLLIEKIYTDFCKNNNIKLLIFRLFNIYGFYQIPYRRGSLIPNILINYLTEKPTEINDLTAQRDFIFAQDMARCVEKAIEDSLEGADDLATNNLISISELIKAINSIIKDGALDIVNQNNKEETNLAKASSNIVKDIKLTPIEIGLCKTLDFYKNNLRLVKEIIK